MEWWTVMTSGIESIRRQRLAERIRRKKGRDQSLF
jgi:hypothetical protein